MEDHAALVAAVAARTKHFHKTQTAFRVYHGATNSTRRSGRRRDNVVDTSALRRILHVDPERKTALVEPNVAMDALVAATLAHGLVPLVVMEFPGITVGGGFSGTSGESSSFRYGAFEATVNAIEIVLPNGEVATASQRENAELFWGAASAAGTLGIVTRLEVQLRKAGRFVELTYRLAPNVVEATAMLQRAANEPKESADAASPVDYLDGIMFAPDAIILCEGHLVDSVPANQTVRRFLRRRDEWFYLHAQRVMKTLQRTPSIACVTVYVPVTDYLFRYDRGGFWMGRYAFSYFHMPFLRPTRILLDVFMHTRVMYRALHQSGMGDFYLVQDVGIPYDHVDEFTRWLDAHIGLYPLWLCPLRVQRDAGEPARHGLHAEFAEPNAPDLMNFGVWGQPKVSPNGSGKGSRADLIQLNRTLESKVHDLGGKKWLYAHAYYTEAEFWAIYDREAYERLRGTYGATYLPSIYEKVRVDYEKEEAARRATPAARRKERLWNIWPLRGVYGVYKVLRGGDYLLQKKAKVEGEGDKMDKI